MTHRAPDRWSSIQASAASRSALEIARRLPLERLHLPRRIKPHVPYGGRPLEESLVLRSDHRAPLCGRRKSGVMACNISSATALAGLQEKFAASRVLGVIIPAHAPQSRRRSRRPIGCSRRRAP